ncbi:MAG: hypothetical protein IPH13_20760 [Planctomycetes bacterium]|nr:hypothetical protein [Planctomycetota bacterium]
MTVYYEIDGSDTVLHVWSIEGPDARCVYDPRQSVHFPRAFPTDDEAIVALPNALPNDPPRGRFVPGKFAVGQYHPRVWRPTCEPYEGQGNPPRDSVARASALGQLSALVRSLREICRTVEPDQSVPGTQSNLLAYGHEIRNLLLIASTEVEALWQGVFEANAPAGPAPNIERLTTSNYVKLLAPMRLSEYSVELAGYPRLPAFVPFGGWDLVAPTQSLAWYDAYNKVKHARERNFPHATLANAIIAVCACLVMIAAQFGPRAQSEVDPFLRLTTLPTWRFDEKYLLPAPDTRMWRSTPLPGLW